MLAKLFILIALVHTPDGDIMRKTKGPFNSQEECQAAQKLEAEFLHKNNIGTNDAMLICVGTPWGLPGVNI